MKTVEELENKIKEIENEVNFTTKEYQDTMKSHVENMEKILEELKKNKNDFEPTPKGWKPKEGEVYYFADAVLSTDFYRYINNEHDNNIIKYNRIFQSEEECRLYCDIQRAFRDASEEYVPYEFNYVLRYNHDCGSTYTTRYHYFRGNELYFDSEETIQNLIDKFGEENVKRYYLGVY